MVKLLWHRRETRRQTENTNLDLRPREEPVYSPKAVRLVADGRHSNCDSPDLTVQTVSEWFAIERPLSPADSQIFPGNVE